MAIIPTSGEFSKVPEGGGSDNRFVVTLTPSADDWSGTMDKTATEIKSAWDAGKSIWFNVPHMGIFPVTSVDTAGQFYGYTVTGNILVSLGTYSPGLVNESAYHTSLFQLTPMGS